MAWKIWVAILVIGAGLGETFAIPVLAVCDSGKSKATMACCCSHDCDSRATSGPGLRSSCCDMRRAPAKSTMPGVPPRETAPLTLAASTLLPDLSQPAAPTITNGPLELPPSLHAPPLYDLFRSYRI